MVDAITERAVKYGGILKVSSDLIEPFCVDSPMPNGGSLDGGYSVVGLQDISQGSARSILNTNIGNFILGFYGTNRIRLDEVVSGNAKLEVAEALDWVVDDAFKPSKPILPKGVEIGVLSDVKICAVLGTEIPERAISSYGSTRRREVHYAALSAFFKLSGVLPKYDNAVIEWAITTMPTATVVSRIDARDVEVDQHIKAKVKAFDRRSFSAVDPTRRGSLVIGNTRTGGDRHRNAANS